MTVSFSSWAAASDRSGEFQNEFYFHDNTFLWERIGLGRNALNRHTYTPCSLWFYDSDSQLLVLRFPSSKFSGIGGHWPSWPPLATPLTDPQRQQSHVFCTYTIAQECPCRRHANWGRTYGKQPSHQRTVESKSKKILLPRPHNWHVPARLSFYIRLWNKIPDRGSLASGLSAFKAADEVWIKSTIDTILKKSRNK